MSTELLGLAFSPWTEKARWPLDYHRIPYHYQEHLIIFGMPSARFKLRRWSGDVTIPALIDGDHRLMDSFLIAQHVDARGESPKLFPNTALKAKLDEFNQLSELAADSIRALVMNRIAHDKEAQMAALPLFVPQALRKPLSLMAGVGLAYLSKEFKVGAKSLEQRDLDLRSVLLRLRQDLKAAQSDYLLEKRFTFADIAMAVALHGVCPPDDRYLRIPTATRRCWTHERLRTEFADLVEWRDRVYSKHRRTA